MTGLGVHKLDRRCLQLCWEPMWHSWKPRGHIAQPSVHVEFLTLLRKPRGHTAQASAPPCQNQPREHPSQHSPAGCPLSFQGFARYALDPKYLLSYDTALISINTVALGAARDNGKGNLSYFPLVETLWFWRLLLSLQNNCYTQTSLCPFLTASLFLLWEPLSVSLGYSSGAFLPGLCCGSRQEQGILGIVKFQNCNHGRWQNCAPWTSQGSHKPCREGSRIDACG